MKRCSKCKQSKNTDCFYSNKSTKDGLSYWCAKCNKNYANSFYKTDKYKILVETNKEQRSQYMKEWRKKNIEKIIEHDKQRYRKDKHRYIAASAKRRSKKINATPAWADMSLIKSIYAMRLLMDELNPFVKHHVDHIIPLQGKNVCGLHVHNNLQILTAQQNLEKSAKFNSDIGE